MSENNNNNFLWTGESVFCLCGHHVECHETRQSALAIRYDREDGYIYYRCNYKDTDKDGDKNEKHPNKPVYPTSKQIRELKLKPQEKF